MNPARAGIDRGGSVDAKGLDRIGQLSANSEAIRDTSSPRAKRDVRPRTSAGRVDRAASCAQRMSNVSPVESL